MIYKLLIILGLLLGVGQYCPAMKRPNAAISQILKEIANEMEIDLEKVAREQDQNFDGYLEINEDLQEEIGIPKKQRISEKSSAENLLNLPNIPAMLIPLTPASPQTVVNVPSFECVFCQLTFTKKGKRDEHYITKHRIDSRYKCPHPECSFTTKRNPAELISNHYKPVHLNQKRFACAHCSETFSKKSGLGKHLNEKKCLQPVARAVAESKKIKCSYCEELFSKNKALIAHAEVAHPGETEIFGCAFRDCNKSFNSQDALKKHDDKYHERKYTCPDCNKSFQANSILKLHQDKDHKGIRHSCAQCDKSFSQKSSLSSHIKTKHFATSIAIPLIPLLSIETPRSESQEGMLQDSIEQEKSEHYADMPEIDNLHNLGE